jgi:MinD-like ATPase involved in chromosome partitioning or flagellar assembly/ActR/RegA family two-component response regulator
MENEPLSILIVDKDVRSRSFLSAFLLREGYEVQVAEMGKEGHISALRDHPDVVIFDAGMSDIRPADFIRKLHADRRTLKTICIALALKPNPTQMAELRVAGCSEYLIKGDDTPQKIVKFIAGIRSGQVTDESALPEPAVKKKSQEPGLLVVFLSAKGGTGTSSLCANIAHSVARSQKSLDVAVMDMVMPIGSISSIVGFDRGINLVAAAAHPADDLTDEYLRHSISALPSWKFRLLAGAPDPEAANSVDALRVPVLIRAFRQTFDATFVDLGRALSRISIPIILEADVVVIVTGADINTLAVTQVMWDYLQSKGIDSQRVYMLMNRATGLEGLTKNEAERKMGIPIQETVPYMGANFSLANDQHLPVLEMVPDDDAAMKLDQIAHEIFETARKASSK